MTTSVEAALRIVDDLQKQGYEFVTVEELLVQFKENVGKGLDNDRILLS